MIPTVITVTMPKDLGHRKVSIIKALRSLTNAGLKEAKEMSERSGPQNLNVNVWTFEPLSGAYVSDPNSYWSLVQDLREFGVVVQEHTVRESTIRNIKSLACDSILNGEYAIAISLINVLKDNA